MNNFQKMNYWFRHHSAFRIGIIYFIISILWIFFSDKLILYISRDLQSITQYQTVKGIFFVIITTIIIYFLIFNELKRKNKLIKKINTNKRWYNTLFSNIPRTDIYLFDNKMNFILAQGNQIKNDELQPEAIEGKNINDLPLPKNMIGFLKNHYQKILNNTNVHEEFEYNEQWFELRGSPLINEKGSVYAGVVVIFNISEYKNTIKEIEKNKNEAEALYEEYISTNDQLKEKNEELNQAKKETEESEAKYRTFIENTNEGIYHIELNPPMPKNIDTESVYDHIINYAYIAECNNAFAKSYGFKNADSIIGKSLKEFHSKNNIFQKRDILKSFIENGYELNSLESIEQTIDGKEIYFTKNITGIFSENKLTGAWVTQTNITKQKTFEKELIDAKQKAEESDRLKSAFLANMSHEIRTPLNGILGFSYLLTKKKQATKEEHKFASIISNNGKQLLHLINDILDISKIEAEQMALSEENFSVNKLMDEIYTQYMNNEYLTEKNLSLKYYTELNNKDAMITLDRVRLMQVIENLLNNAIKFTKEGEISFGYTLADENTIKFYVKDTGVGIPKEKQGLIFQRFHQHTNDQITQKGTGLGLAICKGITGLYNGNIWIDSEENKGTTFYVTLPYKPAANENTETAKQTNINLKNKNILVVDDDPNSYELMHAILKKHKVNLLFAGDGEKAVEQCKNNKKIDLVLMDLKLPKKDGYKATKEIKSIRAKLPVIAQTAYAMPEEKEKSKKYKFDGYITKPIEEKKLMEILDQIIS